MRTTWMRAGAAVLTGALAATGAGVAAAAPAPGDEVDDARLVLLLDASGSMAEPDASGAPRIDAARTALDAAIGALDDDAQVGFRVFGATVVGQETAGACEDTQQVVPVGAVDRDALADAVDAYEPYGETPIGAGLLGAAADLGDEGRRTILLVSDGLSNCQPDPCEVAASLQAAGVELVVNVVGLDVDAAARAQLSCIASATGGSYVDADDTDTLTAAIGALATRAFRPFALTGEPIEAGATEQDATALATGSWLGTLGSTDGYYRLERTIPGSTLHVGLTTLNGTDAYESIFAAAYPPGGESRSGFRCAEGVATGGSSSEANRLAATALVVSDGLAQGDVDAACMEGDVILEVRDGGALAGQRVEIVVTEEPPIVAGQDLPPAATEAGEGWSLAAAATVDDLVPGTAFSDAPTIEPGVAYALDVAPGESQTLAIEVGWGQELRIQADVPTSPPGLDGLFVTLDVADPYRADVLAGNVGPDFVRLAPGTIPTMTVAVPPVAYASRTASCASTCPSIAGTYTIVVSASGAATPMTSTIPYTLTTALEGEAGPGPEYVAPPPQPATSDAAAAGGSDDAATGPDVLGIVLGTVGLVLVGVGVAIAVRRRRGGRPAAS
ncbi:vWA domain-containing protein [Agrococcus sp. SGAir0287]|uniref:vWA domain-containing protein n=1 Tax=Agrococcus sp. SGAir0287 TaxID=2070347 RepID=UPI0015866B22|nr:VWA domain-containing protein [Agrococcus sp. SGAir0287]